jgi:hypothetical protein
MQHHFYSDKAAFHGENDILHHRVGGKQLEELEDNTLIHSCHYLWMGYLPVNWNYENRKQFFGIIDIPNSTLLVYT